MVLHYIPDYVVHLRPTTHLMSDNLIRKTIINVMKEFAETGNTIIVGRAGVALSQHVDRSFNIRLMAPIQWRIKHISRKHGITEEAAKKYIDEIDYRRTQLIEEFYGNKLEDSMFDVIFNCESFSKEEIVNSSLELMKVKGLI